MLTLLRQVKFVRLFKVTVLNLNEIMMKPERNCEANLFLQSVLNQFHVIISSLPMQFYKWLSKNFPNPLLKMEK